MISGDGLDITVSREHLCIRIKYYPAWMHRDPTPFIQLDISMGGKCFE